jgi:hypothetical protein
VDIADGFYRIWVNVDNITKLAVALPPLGSTEPLVALPLVLPMGWTESLPYFCAATETVTDISNRRLLNRWKAPPHRLEVMANTRPPPEAEGNGTHTLPFAEGPKPPFEGTPTAPFATPTASRPHNQRTATDLASRPTRIMYKIVSQPDPELLGAQNTCGDGMGGVWFPTTTKLHERRGTIVHGPLLWRAPFDEDITSYLISFKNPKAPSPIPTWS